MEKLIELLNEYEENRPMELSRQYRRKEMPIFKGGLVAISEYDDEMVDNSDLLAVSKGIILEYKKASATFLSRKMNTSFAMAINIIDELENRGIIGPQVGAKPREIYFDNIKIDE